MAIKITKKADPYRQQVQAAVNQRYRPQQQEIAGELRVSRQQDRNIHGWYQGYLNDVKQAEAQSAQGYANAAAQIGHAADTSTQTDRSNRQQLMSKLYADAQGRGATVDPGLEATATQAEASRRTGLDEAQAGTVRTGANANAYLADKGRIGAGAEIGAHQAEAGRRTVLRQKRAGLKLDAADYGQSVRSSLVQADANRQLAQASLGLKAGSLKVQQQNAQTAAQRAQNTARHQQILDGIAQGRLQLDGSKFRSTQQQKRYQQRYHLGPYALRAPRAGRTPRAPRPESQSSRSFKTSIDNAVGSIRQYQAQGLTGPEISAIARGQRPPPGQTKPGSALPPVILNAARDIAYHGYLSGNSIAALRRAGVRIPRAWLPRRGRSGTSTNNSTHGG